MIGSGFPAAATNRLRTDAASRALITGRVPSWSELHGFSRNRPDDCRGSLSQSRIGTVHELMSRPHRTGHCEFALNARGCRQKRALPAYGREDRPSLHCRIGHDADRWSAGRPVAQEAFRRQDEQIGEEALRREITALGNFLESLRFAQGKGKPCHRLTQPLSSWGSAAPLRPGRKGSWGAAPRRGSPRERPTPHPLLLLFRTPVSGPLSGSQHPEESPKPGGSSYRQKDVWGYRYSYWGAAHGR